MKKVTDPNLIAQLNSAASQQTPGQVAGESSRVMRRVTNPNLVAQLNAQSGQPQDSQPTQDAVMKDPNFGSAARSIWGDIKRSASEAPGAALDALKSLPMQALMAGRLAVDDPVRAIGDVAAGGLEGAKGLYNLPLNIVHYLGEKGVPGFVNIGHAAPKYRIGETGLQKAIFGEDKPGEEFLRGIGGFGPYGKIAGLASGLKGAARRAGAAGAYAAGQNEDPLKSALMGLAGEAVGKGAGVASNVGALRPSRFIKTPLSAENLRDSLRQTAGTETGLGDVIESPILKKQYENILAKVPFSGAVPAMQRTAETIKNRGKDLLDDMLKGEAPENIGVHLQKALKKAEKDAQKQKRANYEKVNKVADDLGVKVGRDNLSLTAQETLEDLSKSPELMREADKKLVSDLKALSDSSASNNLRLSNIFKGKLGDRANEAWEKGDQFTYSIYRGLKDALNKDIDSSIKNSGSDNLKSLHKESNKFYKDNIAPFEDPTVMRYTRGSADPDLLLNSFLRSSRLSDRSNLLSSLMSKLPEKDKGLVSYAHFSRAMDDGELNPIKFKSFYEDLRPKQRKVLLKGMDFKDNLADYVNLVKKNTEPLSLMFNPNTGARLQAKTPYIASTIGAGLGGALGGVPGAILGPVAIGLGTRPLVKALTSEKLRKNLVEKMAKEKERGPRYSRNVGPELQFLTQALSNQQNNRDN